MRLALREALLAFKRAPLLSVLSVTTIAFSLFALGLFALVAVNIRDALREVEERVEIRAFLPDTIPQPDVIMAAADVRTFPEVASVRYVSPEEALERARRELGEFSDVFDAAVLPPSIEVSLRPGRRDPATVRAVAARVAAATGADDVRYGEEWVQKLYRIRTLATAAGVALGVAFATVAVIIIGATIRMAVLARSPEIQIMRLVGATDWFVRLPFLIEGLVKGVLGGVLALVLLWTAHAVVDRYFVRSAFFEAPIAVAGVVAGALLGLVGSAVSVGRHLRLVERDRRRSTRV